MSYKNPFNGKIKEPKGDIMFNSIMITTHTAEETNGIIIPENQREMYAEQFVVKVGESVSTKSLKPGAKVLLDVAGLSARKAGLPIEIDGEQYVIINERDIVYIY